MKKLFRYRVGDVLVKTDSHDLFTITVIYKNQVHVIWGEGKTGYFGTETLEGYLRSGVYTIKNSTPVTLPEELFTL